MSSGYLACDGSLYDTYQYPALFNAIGYTYGGYPQYQTFRVPNYRGLFLRGRGAQDVNLPVIEGRTPVKKEYSSPPLGTIVPHQNEEIITANYIYQINPDDVKSFVTGPKPFQLPSSSFNYSNGLASISYNTSHDTINAGNTETFPAHTSIQYFLKH